MEGQEEFEVYYLKRCQQDIALDSDWKLSSISILDHVLVGIVPHHAIPIPASSSQSHRLDILH